MEFKKLEIQPEGNWLKQAIASRHIRKTLVYIVIGALAVFVFTVLTSGKPFAELSNGEIFQSLIFGGFIGFFLTNSPCARNKC